MPNAGLPQLTADGAVYPLQPIELADALEQFVGEFGLGLVGGCCGTGPEHLRQVVMRLEGRPIGARSPPSHPPCTPRCPSARTSAICRSNGPTPTGQRRFARRCLAERWDDCVDIARSQIRDGAHMLDLNIDYVGRDGVADMRELAFGWRRRRRCPSCWTPPNRRCCKRAWNVSVDAR